MIMASLPVEKKKCRTSQLKSEVKILSSLGDKSFATRRGIKFQEKLKRVLHGLRVNKTPPSDVGWGRIIEGG